MSNWMDKVEEWAARQPSESFGEYYFRALQAILYIGFVTGLMAGIILGCMAGDYAIRHIN